MAKEKFQSLLVGNLIGSSQEANISEIIREFQSANVDDRNTYFDLILGSTRYDVMELLVDQKILSEAELFNIAFRCKIEELRMTGESESVQARIFIKALDQLDQSRHAEFYSTLVDELIAGKNDKLLEPSKEKLEQLYEGLFVAGHGEALGKLHDYLGYYRGHNGKNSEELIAAFKEENIELAQKLLSKGHYVYDFLPFDAWYSSMIFSGGLVHPNFNINAIRRLKETPLISVAQYGSPEQIKALIDKGVDVNAAQYRGETALHLAAEKGRRDIVKMLIDNGAKINAISDESNCTPLLCAVYGGHEGVVRELLDANARIDERKLDDGAQALHIACFSRRPDIVEMLLTAGADVNAKDKSGDDPIQYATFYPGRGDPEPQIVQLLLAHGWRPQLNMLLHNSFSAEANSVLRAGFVKNHVHHVVSSGWEALGKTADVLTDGLSNDLSNKQGKVSKKRGRDEGEGFADVEIKRIKKGPTQHER
jgi:hypothetical protein